MINLRNISKTYVTKSKTATQALKDVSLDIENRGMIIVLGKSGSGKSTLLNLLGGLDAPTSGEIYVDGVSMKQFSQRDYDMYRNNYVGFIFQEFNLLADFNVRDNVALALKLSKSDNIDAKVTDALKQVELNDSYLNRRIDEMSGGEKQRIAIARAIIKDSKIILADEPTGNLDSATGESIWNILKNLSRDRLVVVVSHDRESAEKYADRIIEIADGQIVSDNGATEQQIITQQNSFVATKQRLAFATRLKMGYNTLRLRKAKTVSVILLAIFSILSILITQMCLSFSSELTLAKYIKQNDLKYFTVSQGCIDGYNNLFTTAGADPWKNRTIRYIADNCTYIKDSMIQSKQDILDMGFEFVGDALEIDDGSFYITETGLERFYYQGGFYVEVDGEFVELVQEIYPPEFLVGKNIHTSEATLGIGNAVLAGVVRTSHLTNASFLPWIFYTENFDGRSVPNSITFNSSDPKEVTLHLSDKRYDNKFEVTDYMGSLILNDRSTIVSADGIVTNTKFELADNEIVLPYELYAQMFNANSKLYYVNAELTEVRNMPEEIGQTFEIKFCEYDSGELILDCGELKIVGISFTFDLYQDKAIAVSNNLMRKIDEELSSSRILVSVDSIKNLNDFVYTLRKDYLGYIYDVGTVEARSITGQSTTEVDIAEMTYEFEIIITLLSIVFSVVGAILLIVLVLLVINLISFSIANRKKEVGILSALGASNADITSIFLLETLIISAISFVLILALVFVFAFVFNSVFSKAYLLNFVYPFLRVDWLSITILIALCFGFVMLAALIPIRKIIRLKPIDAIRNV